MYLFNAKIEDPEKLEKMLVGRAPIVNTLVDAQIQHSKGGMPPQFLVVGPRGSGKTHMLRIIYDRLSKNAEFMAIHEIAYMVEDETGIASYFDLLQRVFEALKRWSNDEQKKRFIVEQVENMKEIHPKDWSKSAEDILLNFLNGKSLLILIENFDSILKGIDRKNAVQELAKLRDFIQQHNQLSFIATSQSLINSLSDNQNPLYGFFNIIQLKRLTLDESFEYVKKVALSENNDELVQFLETHDGKGHLEAIHQFTKGNHRLLLVFFDFLKAEFRSNLSDVFLKSIDELKPYYESFIRNLAPQQQKIVQYLCLQRNPQKGADIGRNCFLDKNTVSKQLSELQLLGYVSAVNEKGRDKYYEINEPLLRMCIEINEDRNGIIKLFVNFLGQLYTAEQLKEKYLHFNYLERFQPEPIRKLYQSEAKIYSMVRSQFLSNWKLNEEEVKKLDMCCEPDEAKRMIQNLSHQKETNIEQIKQITELIEANELKEAIDVIKRQMGDRPADGNLYSVLGAAYGLDKQYEKAIEACLKAIEINSKNEIAWNNLGNSYALKKEYEKATEAYQKAISINPMYEKVWFNLSISYREVKKYEKAIEALQKAIEINPEDDSSWFSLGVLFNFTNEFKKAIEVYQKVIEINPHDEIAWLNLGASYSFMKEFQASIEAYQKAIHINPNNEKSWQDLGDSYRDLKESTKAIEAYQKAININPHNEKLWFDLSTSYIESEEYEKALEALHKSIEINPNNGKLWNILGYLFVLTKEYKKALEAYKKAIEINPKDEIAWSDLGDLYDIIDEYEKAIEAYQKAIEINPDYNKVWNNLGITYYKQEFRVEARDAFIKAIESIADTENENIGRYYSNLIEVQFALKETSEALTSIETLFSKPERLEFITKLEDALVLLCKENSEDAVKEVFKKLLQICESNGANEKLSALLSNVVFRILREYQKIKPFRIELLQHILEELFSGKDEFTYPLRYLNIGIKYFLKNEKEAIYEMSQEERMIFEKFTSPDSKE